MAGHTRCCTSAPRRAPGQIAVERIAGEEARRAHSSVLLAPGIHRLDLSLGRFRSTMPAAVAWHDQAGAEFGGKGVKLVEEPVGVPDLQRARLQPGHEGAGGDMRAGMADQQGVRSAAGCRRVVHLPELHASATTMRRRQGLWPNQ